MRIIAFNPECNKQGDTVVPFVGVILPLVPTHCTHSIDADYGITGEWRCYAKGPIQAY
jgi:hypothetical protein